MSMFANSLDRSRHVPWKGGPLVRESSAVVRLKPHHGVDQRQTFSKVFRYHLPGGQTEEPGTVEVIGSFTHWHRVALFRDGRVDAWHVTIHHIPGNRTHHYMLLLDGQPAFDPTCDGLTPPFGMQEEEFQLDTINGPRVMMLFAQTR